MGIFSRLNPKLTNYVSSYVGNPFSEVVNLAQARQLKQQKVIDTRDDLGEALSMASRNLDDEDRQAFAVYSNQLRDELSQISEDKYVGNLDNKLRNKAIDFQNTHSHFKENTERKQKYIEALAQSGLSEEEQAMYLNYAKAKSGTINYDPINKGIRNKFVPVNILKAPDVKGVVNSLKGEIPTEERTYYVNPENPKQVSEMPVAGWHTAKVKQRVVGKDRVEKIGDMLLNDPDYVKYIKRTAELGGKDYAEKKHTEILKSIVSGVSVGDFSNTEIKEDESSKELRTHANKKLFDKKLEDKESEDLNGMLLPTPQNSRMHEFKDVGDIDREANTNFEKGNKEVGNNQVAYKNRLLKKYGLSAKDYELMNYAGYHKVQVSAEKKKLFDMVNRDLEKDSQVATTTYKSFTPNKESQLGMLDRNFEAMVGNLTTGSRKGSAYIPEDMLTGKPLDEDQMKKLKNVKYVSTILTSDGVFQIGRSSGSEKDRKDGASESDFTFRLKPTNQEDILRNLVKMKKIDGKTATSLMLTQGVDNMYGEKKRIPLHNKQTLFVRRVLPSEDKQGVEYEISDLSGNKVTASNYNELLGIINNKM